MAKPYQCGTVIITAVNVIVKVWAAVLLSLEIPEEKAEHILVLNKTTEMAGTQFQLIWSYGHLTVTTNHLVEGNAHLLTDENIIYWAKLQLGQGGHQ